MDEARYSQHSYVRQTPQRIELPDYVPLNSSESRSPEKPIESKNDYDFDVNESTINHDTNSLSHDRGYFNDREGENYSDFDYDFSKSRSSHRSYLYKPYYSNTKTKTRASVFSRLGTAFTRSPDHYVMEKPPNERNNYHYQQEDEPNFHRSNILVRYTNSHHPRTVYDNQMIDSEVISQIRELENDQKELTAHCLGLKNTVKGFFKEISKLETMVQQNAYEIQALKRKFSHNFMD